MILGIDTATTRTAVSVGANLLNWPERPNQAESLMDDIAEAMAAAKASWADITAVIAYTGPGSFTGLRVGLAAGQGFAFSRNIPLYGVRLDEAFSWCVTNDADQMLLLDTRRDDLAVARRAAGEAAFGPLVELTVDDIKAELEKKPALILGNGCKMYTEKTSPVNEQGQSWVSIDSVARVFEKRHAPMQKHYMAVNAEVFYLRAPDVTISDKKFEHRALYTQ